MSDPTPSDESSEAAAFQGGDRVPSMTPQGQAMNPSRTEAERVTAVPKSDGAQGQAWESDKPEDGSGQVGGYGMELPESLPDNRAHEGGDPALDGDAQYGASPVRSARYDENHEVTADMAVGKPRSGHHGAQARYPKSENSVAGPAGHDEQQQSRDLANGR